MKTATQPLSTPVNKLFLTAESKDKNKHYADFRCQKSEWELKYGIDYDERITGKVPKSFTCL